MSKRPLEALTETMFYVLMSFRKRDLCGAEIADFVERKTCGRVRLGHLSKQYFYRIPGFGKNTAIASVVHLSLIHILKSIISCSINKAMCFA